VASFPRPGGNVTGFMVMEPTMAGKWLELLKEIAPRVARVALLFNPATATYAEYYLKPFKAAAASLAVEAIALPVRDTSELETVIATHAREPNGGLIVMPDTFNDAHRAESHRWRLATASLRSVRSASLLKSGACCRTEVYRLIIFGAQHSTLIAFSRARSRATFPSKPQLISC
jgi:ABC transporter substrate binding protein